MSPLFELLSTNSSQDINPFTALHRVFSFLLLDVTQLVPTARTQTNITIYNRAGQLQPTGGPHNSLRTRLKAGD